jgi:succinyl-CoA synthetase alpha subunit
MTDLRPALARFLRPRSIAVVGASPEPLSVGNNVLVNLRSFGFSGDLHFVSRSRAEIDGVPCVPTIDDLPMGVDALVLIVPAQAVLESIEACARRGVGGVVVFASGFSEQDEAGAQAQTAFAQVARAAGMAVLGPNCIGCVNYADGVPLTFEPVEPRPTKGPGVCVIAQSGAMQGNVRYALMARGVPVAQSISTGNEAVLSAEDYLDLLIEDPSISAFSLFVEQIRDPQRFLMLARRARAAAKPIVLLHPGQSSRAREAARSHTGALAGDHAIMRACIEREGVIMVGGIDELFDVTTLVARYPEPVTGGVGVLSNSGALRGFSLDFCEEIGLDLPELSPATHAALKAVLPSFATIDNPLDITAAGMQKPSLFGDSAAVMLDDPRVGFLLVAAMGGGKPQQLNKWRAMRPVLEAAKKPVAVAYMGDDYPLDDLFMQEMRDSGIPFFRSPDRALRALGRLAAHARAQPKTHEPAATESPPPFDTHGPVAEWRGKQALKALGIATPQGGLAHDLAEARAIAARIGYPVVIKAQADALAHKSEAGGVIVGVADEAALVEAHGRLLANVRAYDAALRLDGVLVERMAPQGGLEMIVGARRDPQWGPVIVVGLGGVWTEALHDARLLPAQANKAEITAALHQLKGAALLGGLRGAAPRDVEAIAQIAASIGALMQADPHIAEIDLNPVNVYAQGEGALALDALFIMS